MTTPKTSKILWFGIGFISCLIIAIIVSTVEWHRRAYGFIRYMNEGEVTINGDRLSDAKINRTGMALEYGRYYIKLKSGKTLVVHKNNRGNVSISESGDLVSVESDDNVLGVWLE